MKLLTFAAFVIISSIVEVVLDKTLGVDLSGLSVPKMIATSAMHKSFTGAFLLFIFSLSITFQSQKEDKV